MSQAIYFTQTGGRTIFLDVAANRYFALPQNSEGAFTRMWGEMLLSSADKRALQSLTSLGIELDAPHSMLHQTQVPRVRFSSSEKPRPKPSLFTIGFAAFLQLAARRLVKHAGIEALISKLNPPSRSEPSTTSKEERVLQILDAHRRASMIIGMHDRCLEKSFAIAHHLHMCGIQCTVVLGVRAAPFLAHCWVQSEDCVLNDDLERVCSFSPILAS